MLVTVAFTVAATLGVLVHSFYLVRIWGDYRAVRRSGQDGPLLRTARTFLQVESARSLINLLMLAAGAGVLLGFRFAAFALILVPVVSMVASSIAFRGFR